MKAEWGRLWVCLTCFVVGDLLAICVGQVGGGGMRFVSLGVKMCDKTDDFLFLRK